ncbi:MAG: TlyA family RNA methyltransferase [Actinomycetota bacterium]|nr:TlyA family RNA methyltransferase [Actinomycetota bacterium]
MAAAPLRLDKALVARGLARSREVALSMIDAGHVLVNGSIAQKATRQVRSSDQIVVANHFPRYVGRGAEKLLGLIERHPLTIDGVDVADLGSSTGGFTQVLLENGATRVFAIDVGRGQLDQMLRSHPKVEVMEGVNLRLLDRSDFALPTIDLAVGDLSFISLTKLIDPIVDVVLERSGQFAMLIKPQFEVEREVAARYKGVITDPQYWRSAILKVVEGFIAVGAEIDDLILSPISGGDGNREFFVVGRVNSSAIRSVELSIDQLIDREVELAIRSSQKG